jgi:hypothetical protein
MKRLTDEQWVIIFNNLHEDNEEVEIVYLDTNNEYGLCFDCELFEDGFQTEKEAQERLNELENRLL